MTYEFITFEKQNGVARLTLNKPPFNVLNIAMMREINSALDGLGADPAVKVLVFEAAEGSRAFSAGVDISDHTADKVEEMIEPSWQWWVGRPWVAAANWPSFAT